LKKLTAHFDRQELDRSYRKGKYSKMKILNLFWKIHEILERRNQYFDIDGERVFIQKY